MFVVTRRWTLGPMTLPLSLGSSGMEVPRGQVPFSSLLCLYQFDVPRRTRYTRPSPQVRHDTTTLFEKVGTPLRQVVERSNRTRRWFSELDKVFPRLGLLYITRLQNLQYCQRCIIPKITYSLSYRGFHIQSTSQRFLSERRVSSPMVIYSPLTIESRTLS